MKIFYYQAECGDAARIRYKGEDGKYHNLFIDSGFDRTFRHILSSELEKIREAEEVIDGWVVSHIHDDHIGGVVRYLDTVESGEFDDLVQAWYYNPPRQYALLEESRNKVSKIMSIGQGDLLYNYLHRKGKVPPRDIVSGETIAGLDGLQVRVLSPSATKLSKLRKKYSKPGVPLEQNEADSVSKAVAAKSFDYHIEMEKFDLSKWSQDASVENGSSISLLTTYKSSNILWLADSHPSDIVKSLKDMGYTNQNKLKCQWVKVTHHGSKGNNSNALYSLIDCENYLISANGENNHCLPTKECIVRIIRNAHRTKGSKYRFYFTYDNATLREIFANEDPGIFDKWNFELFYLTEGRYYEFEIL